MKINKKRAWSLLLAVTMVLTLLPATAFAAEVAKYYVDLNGNRQDVTATEIEGGTKTLDGGGTTGGWYVVTGNVTINNGVNRNIIGVSGDVRLILEDGCRLQSGSILIDSGASLTIYGQAAGSGELSAHSALSIEPGIGGVHGNSTVTINGGRVEGEGSDDSAGIGGGGMGIGNSTVTINGGTVTATSTFGAGIGSGDGGTVTINGGSVKASSIQPTPTNGAVNGNGTVHLTTVTLDGVSAATAVTSLTASASYTYGAKGMYTDTSGKLYLWLPDGASVTAVQTAAHSYSGSVAANTSGTLYEIPAVSSVSVPAGGSYKAGDMLDFTVNFSAAVTVTGTPYIPLTVGSATVKVSYTSGSGTSSLVFRYKAASGDNDADGITLGSAIALNGGAIKSSDAADAQLTLNNASSTAGILVDAVEPTVSAVTPSNGAANVPVSGNITITFSEAMNSLVVGTVSLTPSGGSAVSLPGGSWSNGNTTYTVSYSALSYDTPYIMEISGFQDKAGNAMSARSDAFTSEGRPLAPSVSPSDALTINKGGTATVTLSFGRGTSAAIGAGIMIVDNGIVSADSTFLTAAGTVTLTGLSVGTTRLMVNFLTFPPGTPIEIPIIVQAVAPIWPSDSTLTAAGSITSSGATLTWSAAQDNTAVTGYKLYQNGTEIASVGGSVYSYTVTGLAPSTGYTFQVQGGNADGVWSTLGPTVTVTTQPLPSGSDDDPDEDVPSYTVKTLSDSITGITVSGTLSANTALKLGELTLSDSNAGSAIRQMMENKQWTLIWGRDISLTGGFQGTLKITIPVGTQYNGQTVTLLHDAQGTLETYTAVVENGQVSFRVSSLSPFAVFVPSGGDSPQAVSHSITVDNDGHGSGSAGVAGAVQGEKVTLTAAPKPGYRFKAWQIITPADLSLSGNTLTMPDQAVVVKAVFEAEETEPVEQGGERIYGETRYDTAIEIAKAYFKAGTATVILVRGDSSADALPAVPLAKAYNAPLLLTQPDRLPAEVLEEIKALGAKKVVIIGGPGAVKGTVEESLKAAGLQVERIYGQTQYDTAYEIAKRLGATTGAAVLVNGNLSERTYADALSISSWAGYNGVPILYVDSTSNKLPEATARALSELKISRTLLIGGTAVVPASLEKLVPNPERYGGTTAYDTNVLVLGSLQSAPGGIYLATGRDFADALAGATVAAQHTGWLILTGGGASGLTEAQINLLSGRQGAIKAFQVFGGPAVVPESTLESVKSILGL